MTNKNNKELTLTSLEDLKKYKEGKLVELPPFAEGQPFVARIKRPSLMGLIKHGKIPNQLVATANSLFTGKAKIPDKNKSNEDETSEFYDILDAIAEACFVEPTYKELKDNGIELADDQYVFLFNYTQTGVESLKSFRKK
jgi:hypothetical protein